MWAISELNILSRKKSDPHINLNLPKKTQLVVFCEMGSKQVR